MKERDINDLIASVDLCEFLPHRMIRIQPMSASLHYGHAIFEGMSMVKVDGRLRLFHPWLNLERMRGNSRVVGLEMEKFPDDHIIATAFSLAALNSFDGKRCRIPVLRRGGKHINKFYVRPLLFVESDGFGLSAESRTRLLLSVFQMGDYMKHDPAVGVETMISPVARIVPFPSVKASSNYQLGIIARRRMEEFNREHGASCREVIFPDEGGKLIEGCVENISFIRDGELITPHPSKGALPGITLRLAASIASEMGLRVRYGSFSPDELARSDCAFMTGNAIGIVPISSMARVDKDYRLVRWHELESAENEFLVRIKAEYEKMETAQDSYAYLHERMEDWLTGEARHRLNSVGKRFVEKFVESRMSVPRGHMPIHMKAEHQAGPPRGQTMLRKYGLDSFYSKGGMV